MTVHCRLSQKHLAPLADNRAIEVIERRVEASASDAEDSRLAEPRYDSAVEDVA